MSDCRFLVVYLYSINTKQIIDKLSRDPRFKSICKGIAKRPHLADDLYQEFFLALCEIKDNRLEEAQDGGYLDVFCVGVINNIWNNRDRVKTYRKGSTSPLHEISNITIPIFEEVSHSERNGNKREHRGAGVSENHLPNYIPEYDIKIDHEYNLIQNIIDEERKSENQTDAYRARIFYYSNTHYKNPKQFSKHVDIPYRAVIESYNIFKEKLKEKLLKCRLY